MEAPQLQVYSSFLKWGQWDYGNLWDVHRSAMYFMPALWGWYGECSPPISEFS